jgi:hypothetical protein
MFSKKFKKINIWLILAIFLSSWIVGGLNALAQENLVIVNIEIANISDRTATIIVTTNVNSWVKIDFGEEEDKLNYFVADSRLAKYHQIFLANLKPETEYYYRVVADNNYEQVYSFKRKFKTGKYNDDIPPKISNLKRLYLSGTVAVFSWQTDEPATTQVDYGLDTSYSYHWKDKHKTREHIAIIRNLRPATSYFARIYSIDQAGNRSGYFYKNFTALATDKIDHEDLEISQFRPNSAADPLVTTNSITIKFKTNHLARGSASLSAKGFKTLRQELPYGTNQTIVFTNLNAGTRYNLKIYLTDIFKKKRTFELTIATKDLATIQSPWAGAGGNTVGIGGTIAAVSQISGNIECSERIFSQSGYYGRYYRIAQDRTYPLKVDSPTETEYFSETKFALSRLDNDLNFGKNFYPFGKGNHFAAYWRAIILVPESGEYSYKMSSDDNAWIYIDGKLEAKQHAKKYHSKGEINLTAGAHTLEAYFVYRGRTGSMFSFYFTGEDGDKIKAYPWPLDCDFSQWVPSAKKNNFGVGGNDNNIIVAGAEFSYYTPVSVLYKTVDSPDVYAIIAGQRHYISSPASFCQYGYRWEDIKTVSRAELEKYPRARLIKSPEKPTIYFLYQRPENKWLKIALNSPSVFVSYPDNYWGKVITVTQLDVDSYPDARLIRKIGDKAVYFLDKNNVKHYVSSVVFRRRGFNPALVVEVNEIHFDSYKTGKALE